MQSTIRGMEEKDRSQVLEMMGVFYASPAVLSNGSEEIFEADFATCISDSPYLEGYIFENAEDIQGYASPLRYQTSLHCCWCLLWIASECPAANWQGL